MLRMTTEGYGVSFWDNENVLDLMVMMVAPLCEHSESHWIIRIN